MARREDLAGNRVSASLLIHIRIQQIDSSGGRFFFGENRGFGGHSASIVIKRCSGVWASDGRGGIMMYTRIGIPFAIALTVVAFAHAESTAQNQAAVQSTNPPAVQLLRGGPSVTMTLQGQALTQLRIGEVYRANGARAGNIGVELGAANSAQRRDITLTANRNTPYCTGFVLRLTTASGEILRAPVDIEVTDVHIAAVKPGSAALVRGGRKVTFDMQGDRLMRVAGGTVIDKTGSPIADVTVKIATDGTRTERQVTLRAAGNMSLGSGFELLIGTKAGAAYEVPLQLSVVPGDPTLVNRTIPASLELAPGTGATIRLRGQRLGQLQATEVRRDGITVSDVTVALESTQEQWRRDILLDASSGAGPMSALELVFTTKAGETVTIGQPPELSVAVATGTSGGVTVGGTAVIEQQPGVPSASTNDAIMAAAPVSITRVRPSRMYLKPDGGWKFIVIDGDNLPQFQTASVQRDGSLVSDVMALLYPGYDSTSVNVTLRLPRLGAALSVPYDVPMDLFLGGHRLRPLRVPVDLSLPGTPADFVISDIRMTGQEANCVGCTRTFFFDITVLNQGNRRLFLSAI